MSQNSRACSISAALALVAAATPVLAQESGPSPDDGTGNTGAPVQSNPGSGPSQVYIPGLPAPGTDINGHLPSSSRGTSDTSKASDGFDLGQKAGPASVRGGENGT